MLQASKRSGNIGVLVELSRQRTRGSDRAWIARRTGKGRI